MKDSRSPMGKNADRGDCYDVHGRFIMDWREQLPEHIGVRLVDIYVRDPDLRLCHGLVDGKRHLAGLRLGHAWLEVSGIVWDFSCGMARLNRREAYYEALGIKEEEVRRYTKDEVEKMCWEHQHWGPWEGILVEMGTLFISKII